MDCQIILYFHLWQRNVVNILSSELLCRPNRSFGHFIMIMIIFRFYCMFSKFVLWTLQTFRRWTSLLHVCSWNCFTLTMSIQSSSVYKCLTSNCPVPWFLNVSSNFAKKYRLCNDVLCKTFFHYFCFFLFYCCYQLLGEIKLFIMQFRLQSIAASEYVLHNLLDLVKNVSVSKTVR